MCTGARSKPAGNETASWWDTYRSQDFSAASSPQTSPFTKSDLSLAKSKSKSVAPGIPRPTSVLSGPVVTPSVTSSVTDPYAELRKQYWNQAAKR